MSDSFADLWSSSAAIPPKPKPQTLASASSSSLHTSTTKGASKSDAFSFLAGPSQQQSRYGSPSSTLGSAGKRSATSTPPVPSREAATGSDAFSGLFSSAPLSATNGNVKSQMTIAERLAIEAKDSRRVREEPDSRSNAGPQDIAWAGLDSLVRPSSISPVATSTAAQPSLSQPQPRQNSLKPATLLDDDDILGMLSQPVAVVKAQTQSQKVSPSPFISRQSSFDNTSNRSLIPQSTSASPPPHVLGQIVEMGFSIEQAKKALANTKDGQDIQAALETLLGGSGITEARRDGPSDERPVEGAQDHHPPAKRGPPKGFRERERERLARMHHEREHEPVASDMQDQADRLLSQASEIGLSVLNKANAFWKEGKERVVKVYEERAATTVQKEKTDGRPKWMKDGGLGGFKDEDDDLKMKEGRTSKEPEQRIRRREKSIEPQLEVDLFSTGPSDPASLRQSRRPSKDDTSASLSQVAAVRTGTPPFPLPKRDRPLPTASPSSLSTVCKHKTAGSSQFKLGQYASAVESYGSAISNLPTGHLLLLPLFNNRALARMRIGEYKSAADDAAQALAVVLVNADPRTSDGFDPARDTSVQVTNSLWHPSMEPSFLLTAAQQKANESGWTHPQGLGVDLADGYAKALRRCAEANEGRERWSEALRYWEVLSVGDLAGIKEHLRKEAQRSAARCRKMMIPDAKGGEEGPKPKPRRSVAKSRPTPAVPTTPSAALRSLQASNAQAEEEDNLKHQLKDSVDSKLAAWRSGKETNIRALLASLDMVLWEELLRGVRVGGLHELVTPAQVKKGYVKAIARVHPDKLNVQNPTVEQRMLANGVFGTLSEAWISFQSSNGM